MRWCNFCQGRLKTGEFLRLKRYVARLGTTNTKVTLCLVMMRDTCHIPIAPTQKCVMMRGHMSHSHWTNKKLCHHDLLY